MLIVIGEKIKLKIYILGLLDIIKLSFKSKSKYDQIKIKKGKDTGLVKANSD